MRRFTGRCHVWLILAGLLASPVAAQYIPPGSTLAGVDELADEESLREGLEAARIKVGVLRLEPWFSIDDASFVTLRNEAAGENETDFTATLGAGLRAYVKNGRHAVWAAHALPEYVWWQDAVDKRGLNGRYGLGFFGYWNRFDLEVSARREERQGFFSSEIRELTTVAQDTARVAFEVELHRRLALYGRWSRESFESREEEVPLFARLDRTDDRFRLGLRLRSPGRWSFGLGFEDSALDFDPGARNLSSTGSAIVVDALYEGPRFEGRVDLAFLSLDPQTGSDLPGIDDTTGNLETLWQLHRSVDLLLYTRRQLRYSVSAGTSVFWNERTGARLGLALQQARFALFAELGDDEFEDLAGRTARRDDVVAYGADLVFGWRPLTFRLYVERSDFDSDDDAFDRDVTVWGASVDLLEWVRRKLRLGGDRVW